MSKKKNSKWYRTTVITTVSYWKRKTMENPETNSCLYENLVMLNVAFKLVENEFTV